MSEQRKVVQDAPTRFALIIGAMKSGTTSLFELLSQHPEIAPASQKEPGFFAAPEVWRKGWDWYTDLWNWDGSQHRVALEASTSYTTYPARPGVPDRIASVRDADFRFIYIMRNPLDQIPSNLRHALYGGWGQSLDEDGVPDWMVDTVRYAMQIDRYTAVFPKERLLLLTLEEFRAKPKEVLGRICGFLDVSTDFSFEEPGRRYNTGEAFEMSPFWARLVKFGPLRAVAYWMIPRDWRHRIRSNLARTSQGGAGLGRFELTERERDDLVSRLTPDLRRLEKEYGVDVRSYWRMSL